MSLSGQTIVFTGTLSMDRKSATAQATAAGAKVRPTRHRPLSSPRKSGVCRHAQVAGSVTGNTTILVAGPGAGAMMEAAAKKGIDVWDEAKASIADRTRDLH